MKPNLLARRFALAAIVSSAAMLAGCASDDPAVEDLPVEATANPGVYNGVPPELADQIEADIANGGGTVTGVSVVGGESGASVYRVTYARNGDSQQADYDRDGRRLATLESPSPAPGTPAAGSAAGATAGAAAANSGPIEQDASQMDQGGDGLGGGADVNNTGRVNAGSDDVVVDLDTTDTNEDDVDGTNLGTGLNRTGPSGVIIDND